MLSTVVYIRCLGTCIETAEGVLAVFVESPQTTSQRRTVCDVSDCFQSTTPHRPLVGVETRRFSMEPAKDEVCTNVEARVNAAGQNSEKP